MCTVCGCGESSVEGHSHDEHHHEEHTHFHHDAEQHHSETPVIIHHHYYHQGDVHHHVYYGFPEDSHSVGHTHAHTHESGETHTHAHDHSHNHEHSHGEDHHEHFHPHEAENGDLHYGTGEAQTHVSGVSQKHLITLEQDILSQNNQVAEHNRAHFNAHHHLALNLMSSPGSGKTTLLTETLNQLKSRIRCAVIEGDQQTSNDADRIRQTQVPAIQVNTGKGCHLDADMIHTAYHKLNLDADGIVFIENVGNLVCPASFDLGEHAKVVILSVTEGEDKPLKYPNMFAAAQLMIINKTDLLPYVDFNVEQCIANARKINPGIQVLKVSAKSGEGLEAWLSWLEQEQAQLR